LVNGFPDSEGAVAASEAFIVLMGHFVGIFIENDSITGLIELFMAANYRVKMHLTAAAALALAQGSDSEFEALVRKFDLGMMLLSNLPEFAMDGHLYDIILRGIWAYLDRIGHFPDRDDIVQAQIGVDGVFEQWLFGIFERESPDRFSEEGRESLASIRQLMELIRAPDN
jgi:hypothetical protein